MLADELWPLFYLRGHTLDWISSLNIALASAEPLGDLDGQARAHKALAVAYSLLQRNADAVGHQRRAIELFRRKGNLLGEAGTLSNLGITNCYLGKLDEAIETLTRSARLYEQFGDANGVGLAYTNIAWVCDDFAGRSAEAITWCNKALAAYGGDLHGRSLVFTNLSSAHRRVGNTEESISCAQQALQAHQKIGHRKGQASAHKHLAEAFAEAGQLEQAPPSLE
ncbi:MAG: tetratricopeptide repeat protein [Actinomycetota bacterium]